MPFTVCCIVYDTLTSLQRNAHILKIHYSIFFISVGGHEDNVPMVAWTERGCGFRAEDFQNAERLHHKLRGPDGSEQAKQGRDVLAETARWLRHAENIRAEGRWGSVQRRTVLRLVASHGGQYLKIVPKLILSQNVNKIL